MYTALFHLTDHLEDHFILVLIDLSQFLIFIYLLKKFFFGGKAEHAVPYFPDQG